MSQDQTPVQDQHEENDAEQYLATLEFGEVYVIWGRTFKHGVAAPVSAEEKAYLEETAIDTITISRGGQRTNSEQPKFTFVPVGGEPAPKAARRRS